MIFEPRLEKGAAALAGLAQGMGDILFLCDANLSRRINELKTFLAQLAIRRDIANGCPRAANHTGKPVYRRFMGQFLRSLVKTFCWIRIPDAH